MAYSTERFLSEQADKIPTDKSSSVQRAIERLRDAIQSGDVERMKSETTAVESAMHAVSEHLYSDSGQGAATGPGGCSSCAGTPGGGCDPGTATDDDLIDAEFTVENDGQT